jgi:3-oxoacyl-[acyl-carrier-protein] synthase-3
MQIRKTGNVRIRSIHTSQPITKNSIETLGIPHDEIAKYSLIAAKLGVQETRILDGEDMVELVKETIRLALDNASLDVSKISTVICVTQTHTYLIPGFSSLLQAASKFSPETRFLDLSQGCAGFVDGVQLATQICSISNDKILLITSEAMSSTLDPHDYGNRLLFGDACSVSIIEYDEEASEICGFMKYDGTGYRGAFLKSDNFNFGSNYFSLNGPAVFSLALKAFEDAKDFVEQLGVGFEGITSIVPHQANTFILEKIAVKYGISDILVNEMKFTGNTSSNSIPVALTTRSKKAEKFFGKNTLCVGFGNGFSWGAISVDFSETQFGQA